jgi:hypothetical protein
LLISVTPFSSQFHRANAPGKPSSDAAELGLSVEQSERAELLREGALSPAIGVLLEEAAEMEDLRGELPAPAEQEVDDVRGEASGWTRLLASRFEEMASFSMLCISADDPFAIILVSHRSSRLLARAVPKQSLYYLFPGGPCRGS